MNTKKVEEILKTIPSTELARKLRKMTIEEVCQEVISAKKDCKK